MPEAVEDGVRRVLRQVACLRLQGVHWAGAAESLDDWSADELMDLAWEHRELWEQTCAQAEHDMVRRLAGKALRALEDLLQDTNAYIVKDAAKTLLTHSRWAAGNQSTDYTDYTDNCQGQESMTSVASVQSVDCSCASVVDLQRVAEIAVEAMEKLSELLHDPESRNQLRSAQSILVQYRWWWRVTHPRVPRERAPKGPDWKAILPWQEEDAPPPPDRISIHENGKLIGQEGRIVEFARPGYPDASWEKTGAAADEYIRELVGGEKPGVEFMWYGHWRGTHFERIAGRDNIPWPPPEEMISGRWYAVWDEEKRDLRVKPLPDSWQTGDPEPPDGWGPNSRASPN